MTRMRRPRWLHFGAVAVGVVVVAAACSGDELAKLPPPPTTVPLATTTTGPDLNGVALAGAMGRTTTTIAIGPGGATLNGTVVAPDGAVPAATIRIERIVGDAVARADIQTNTDGTWAAPNILGGRYRVRAWRAPDLAMTKPQVFFLEADETRPLNLRVNRYEGTAVTSDLAPNPPQVNVPASLVVLVSTKSVDNDGVVRATPIQGARVDLAGSGNWRLESPNPTVTDGNGQARWQLRCRVPGEHPLSAMVNQEATYPLEMPACGEAPPTTTSSTSTTSRSSTSTTRRPTSTTS